MKIIAANSRANYDYSFLYKIDAGLILRGAEVKSLRLNTGSIRGAFIIEKEGELWLSNCFIKKYINSRSQDLKETYHDAGQFFWSLASVLKGPPKEYNYKNSIIEIPTWRSQDIDNNEDWKRAEIVYDLINKDNL